MEIDKYKLITGMPFYIGDYYIVHPLTIREIIEMGYSTLQQHLNIILLEWESLEVDIKEEDRDDETLYKVLGQLFQDSEDFRESFNEACESFLKRPLISRKESPYDSKPYDRIKNFFTPEILGYLREVVTKQYLVSKKEKKKEEKFANERAKKLYEQLEKNKREAEKYKKNESQLIDLISALRWKVGMGKEEILNLTIYELYDGLQRIQVINKVDNTFTGIYSGTINAKKIDKRELDWMKSIEL